VPKHRDNFTFTFLHHLGNLVIDGKIMLKLIIKEKVMSLGRIGSEFSGGLPVTE
jgi:hypothetical protein